MKTSVLLGFIAAYGVSALTQYDHMPQIASGSGHTCLINEDKKVVCWGAGEAGQLGDDENVNQDRPVEMIDLTAEPMSVVAREEGTCVVMASKRVMCTGTGEFGQNGDNSEDDQTKPVLVASLSDVVSADCSASHCCAVKTNGGAACWGLNDESQCLDETTDNALKPVPVKGYATSGIQTVAAGNGFTCILLTTGKIKCAGSNEFGQLGNNDENVDASAELVMVTGRGARPASVSLSAGAAHACLLTTDKTAYCWGSGAAGILGTGETDNVFKPARFIQVRNIMTMVNGPSAAHTCMVLKDGSGMCAGSGENFKLGDGSDDDNEVANSFDTTFDDKAAKIKYMAVGAQLTCAAIMDKGVWCVGLGADGSAGEDNDGVNEALVAVAGIYTGAPTTSPTQFPSYSPRSSGGECSPTAGANARACKKLVKACRNTDKPLRWTGSGCKRGEGGCRCKNYCDFTCKKFCQGKLNRKVCKWKNGACVLKATGMPGNCDA